MPSVAFFLLRSFLRVFLLLLSAYLRFLSEALEFFDGDFFVLAVIALRFATLLFHFYTWYVYLLLSFPCCALVLLVCFWLVWANVFATGCFVNGFEGFCCPPVFYVGCGFSLVGSRVLEWV